MYFHTVIKWIYCQSCKYVIKVKQYRTTQGADTPDEKQAQGSLIERWIRGTDAHGKPGKFYCPKCRGEAQIVDPIVPLMPAYEPDRAKVKANYDAILGMESIEPSSQGKYPTFDEFYEYSRKCRVQACYQKRTLKGFMIAGDNYKRDYTFVPKEASHR